MHIIPGLPDDISLLILALLPYSSYRSLGRVCRSWKRALCANGPVFAARKRLKIVEPCIVFVSMNEPHEFLLVDPVLHGCLKVSPSPPRPFGRPIAIPCRSSIAVVNPMAAGNEILIPDRSLKSFAAQNNREGFNPDVALNCFNLHSLEWTEPVSLLNGDAGQKFCTHFARATSDGYVYVGGCRQGKGFIKQAARLHIASKTWEALPNLTKKRRSTVTVVWHGCICILGGYSDDSSSALSGEMWDPDIRQWMLIPELCPANIFGMDVSICSSVAVVKDTLFVLTCGGVEELLYYDEASQQWISLSKFSAAKLVQSKCNYQNVSVDSFDMVGVADTLFVFCRAKCLFHGGGFIAALYVKPTISKPLTWAVWYLFHDLRSWRRGSILISHV